MIASQHLTHREQQIHDMLIKGLGNKAIGRELGISHRTVEDHRSNIYRKMQVPNSAALVTVAMRRQIEVLTARIAELEGARAQ